MTHDEFGVAMMQVGIGLAIALVVGLMVWFGLYASW